MVTAGPRWLPPPGTGRTVSHASRAGSVRTCPHARHATVAWLRRTDWELQRGQFIGRCPRVAARCSVPVRPPVHRHAGHPCEAPMWRRLPVLQRARALDAGRDAGADPTRSSCCLGCPDGGRQHLLLDDEKLRADRASAPWSLPFGWPAVSFKERSRGCARGARDSVSAHSGPPIQRGRGPRWLYSSTCDISEERRCGRCAGSVRNRVTPGRHPGPIRAGSARCGCPSP